VKAVERGKKRKRRKSRCPHHPIPFLMLTTRKGKRLQGKGQTVGDVLGPGNPHSGKEDTELLCSSSSDDGHRGKKSRAFGPSVEHVMEREEGKKEKHLLCFFLNEGGERKRSFFPSPPPLLFSSSGRRRKKGFSSSCSNLRGSREKGKKEGKTGWAAGLIRQ